MALTKNQKIGVTVGVILGLAGIAVVTYLLLKPKKDDSDDIVVKDAEENYVPPVVTEINLDVPPIEEPKNIKELSYNNVKKKFSKSPNTKVYSDYFTYTVSKSTFGLKGGLGDKIRVKFMSRSGWRIYLIPKGTNREQFLTGGNYYKGGTKLIVRNGINKGLVIEGKNTFNNLLRAVKS